MTDNEIIKALECCIHDDEEVVKELNLMLQSCYKCDDVVSHYKGKLNKAKSEAVKEFVKSFEKKIKDVKFTLGQTWEIQNALKDTLKEMVGDENANRADEKLQDIGFAEITLSQLGVKEWRVYWKHFLTEQQKNFLKPYFEDDVFPMGDIVKMHWERENDYAD